jgi:ATP-dependent Clp protease ATP-binding subunit ClpB
MRLDKLTIKAQEALAAARDLAEQRAHQEVTPEHLLRALVGQEDGVVPAVLHKVGADPEAIGRKADEAVGRHPQVRGSAADAFVGRRLERAPVARYGGQRRGRRQSHPARGWGAPR